MPWNKEQSITFWNMIHILNLDPRSFFKFFFQNCETSHFLTFYGHYPGSWTENYF